MRTLLLATVSSVSLMCGGGAFAQDVAPEEGSEVGEVVVTASRVARTGFAAPTPTTVLGRAQIEARGATNVTDVINEVPAFRASHTTAASTRGGPSAGGSYLDLRGLNGVHGTATARTLVLLDGRRHVPATPNGQVDVNMIPSNLVERTEVVTGGASAAWGSDAIAGVVNIILADRLEGLKTGVSYGISDKGDNKEWALNVAAGTSFLGGRGHVIAGVDYVDSRGVTDALGSRDWGKLGSGTLALGANRPAGLPARVVTGNIRISDRMTPGTIIVGGPLDNIEFTGGQGTRLFRPGSLVGGNQMAGGDNEGLTIPAGSNLVNPIKRVSSLVRVNFDFTPSIAGFAEASYGASEINGFSSSHRLDGNLTIRRDNAFLPESVRAQMTALNLQTVTAGRVAYDPGFGFRPTHTERDTYRFAAGLKGRIFESWNWDAYYQVGESNTLQNNTATIVPNFTAASDAVRDASGNIVCRPGPALALADPGCVPFNVFGLGAPSAAAIDYVQSVVVNDVSTRQEVAAVNLAGDAFTLPAGSVSIATGLEFRREEVSSTVNRDSLLRRFDLGNFQPLVGSYSAKEAYLETVVPILRDQPLAESLELNAAARYTEYSTSGPVTTWKIGLSYEPHRDLRFRATKSRDIRAPNLLELYTAAFQARSSAVHHISGVSSLLDRVTTGNPNLLPEVADTLTAGVVFQPSFLPGFRASVDHFDISIVDVVAQIGAQETVDRCFQGVTGLCANIIGDDGVRYREIRTPYLNLNELRTSGLDIEVSYNLPSVSFIPGSVQLRALGSYVADLINTDNVGSVDSAKASVPEWTWNFGVNYSLGRFSGNAQVRYVGEMKRGATFIGPDDPNYDPAHPDSISNNIRPGVAYLNLSGQYTLRQDADRLLQVFLVANNIFDTAPPGQEALNGVNSSPYDLVGRTFKFGIRFNY